MDIKENDIVLCTVKSIEGTAVFVEIEGNGMGSIVISEVAAGRIRNLREYVSLNKKIVCKILKISGGHIQLSLRRVTAKERNEILERHKKERTFLSLLKTVSKNPEKIMENIKKRESLWSFFDKARENHALLDSVMNKEEAQRLAKIFVEKKESEKKVKKIVVVRSASDSGINDIRKVLDVKNVDISYLGSSQFALSAKAKDFKEAGQRVDAAIQEVEKRAKEKKIFFEKQEK